MGSLLTTHSRQVSSLPKLNQYNSREVSWAVQVCPIIETQSFQPYSTWPLLCKLYLPGCPDPSTGTKTGIMHIHCREHMMEMRGKCFTLGSYFDLCSLPEGNRLTTVCVHHSVVHVSASGVIFSWLLAQHVDRWPCSQRDTTAHRAESWSLRCTRSHSRFV